MAFARIHPDLLRVAEVVNLMLKGKEGDWKTFYLDFHRGDPKFLGKLLDFDAS